MLLPLLRVAFKTVYICFYYALIKVVIIRIIEVFKTINCQRDMIAELFNALLIRIMITSRHLPNILRVQKIAQVSKSSVPHFSQS